MYCQNCGQNQEFGAFCQNCGAPLTAEQDAFVNRGQDSRYAESENFNKEYNSAYQDEKFDPGVGDRRFDWREPQAPVYDQNEECYQPVKKASNGLGVAGFVVSLCGLIFAAVPFFGLVLSLIGLALSIAGMCRKGRKKGLAIAGLVLGILAIIIALLVTLALSAYMATLYAAF